MIRALPGAVLLTLFATLPSFAQTEWFVDATAAPGGTGSAALPFDSISSAVDVAIDGDSVTVLPGIYNETVSFGGKAISIVGQGDAFDFAAPHAVIDGGLVLAHMVRFEDGEGQDSVLENFEVAGGVDSGAGGAGILCIDSSPTIRSCWIRFNTAIESGGGIYCDEASPILDHCWISENGFAPFGGSAFGNGAGLYCIGGSDPIVTDCQFFFNGSDVGNEGGAIYATSDASPIIDRCLIANNTASFGGGIALNSNANAVITNSLIVMNRAAGASGFAGVIPGEGGAMHIRNSTPIITGNTIVMNEAFSADPGLQSIGGGLYLDGLSPEITNTILWQNLAGSDAQIRVTSGTPVVTYSDVMGGFPGVGNLDVDPQFVAPGIFPPDFHLLPTSPLRDAGDLDALGVTDFDFDGEARISCGGVDIGFDEVSTCDGGFRRGDANGDAGVDIADAISILGALFAGGAPATCQDAADVNDDGALDISDAIYGLSALFVPGAPAPPAPGVTSCGSDPTDDVLDCAAYDVCL